MDSTSLPFTELREQAIALRRAGKSRREIKQTLKLPDNSELLTQLLAGEPPPAWTLRPNAKDELRAKARELRAQAFTYAEIAALLRVSKSSVSLWVRDMPREGRLGEQAWRQRGRAAHHAYWERQRRANEAQRAAIRASAAADIGGLNGRELLIAGAIAYWCEGAKNKPHNRHYRIAFINSDPGLVRLFLRFLCAAGVASEDLIFVVHIHESADVAAASRFWLDVTGAPASQFRRPALKRHNPATIRKNTGESYRGCLRVEVRRSSSLYSRVEGWAQAVMRDPADSAEP